MVKNRKRQRTGPKMNDGRVCVVCGNGATPQWRKIAWGGIESDACNRCGISYNDFERRMKRDYGRRPTDLESSAWGNERQDPTVVEAANILVIMSMSMSGLPITISSDVVKASSDSISPSNAASPDATTSTAIGSNAARPPKQARSSDLVVDVSDDLPFSDLGLTSGEESSSAWSNYDLESPKDVSFFPPSDVLRSSAKEFRSKREYSLPAAAGR